MSKDNILRLHKHFSFLAEGNFNERDFSVETSAKRPGEEPGRMSLGKMSPQRRELMVSDAKRHLKELEQKFPELFPKPVVPITVAVPAEEVKANGNN